MRALAVVWLGLLADPVFADPAAFVAERVVVVGRVADGAWTDAPTEARADQKAELAAIVVGHRGRRRVVLAPAGVSSLRLDGRAIAAATLEPLDATTELQWSIVEPHGFRTTTAQNGATSEFYSNVSIESKTFGHWLGYDHVDYFETVVHAWSHDAEIPATITSHDADAIAIAGLGTTRYKLEARGAVALTSPGAEAADTYGISPAVHRVSIRAADDFLGWLSSYLLVPEVFGSAGPGRNHQTERFTGADCADVMVGALRRGGAKVDYTNVAGLPAYTTRVAASTALDDLGAPAHPITGVQRGDLVRIDYGGAFAHHTPRDWDHVAALWEDRSDPDGPHHGGPDGELDGFDLVIHMGHPRLVIEPLARQAPATVDVLRWKK